MEFNVDHESEEKIRKIKLLILDADGVLTDDRIIYDFEDGRTKIFWAPPKNLWAKKLIPSSPQGGVAISFLSDCWKGVVFSRLICGGSPGSRSVRIGRTAEGAIFPRR